MTTRLVIFIVPKFLERKMIGMFWLSFPGSIAKTNQHNMLCEDQL